MIDYLTDMRRRYRERDLPWDEVLPPPEVVAIAEQLPPGRVLDLGCGSGRACIALARRGWCCTGVDIVPEAIALAEERATSAGITHRITFHVASVAHLDVLHPSYDLAIDVGCLHSLSDADAQSYASGLVRLLRPGAVYLLFGRLADTPVREGMYGLSKLRVGTLFAPSLRLDRVVTGTTTTAEGAVRPSAWFWLTRR